MPHRHLTTEELETGSTRSARPADAGTVELIVRRPAEEEREVLAEGVARPRREGLVGDMWIARGSKRRRMAPRTLTCSSTLMSARVVDLRRAPTVSAGRSPATSSTSTSTSPGKPTPARGSASVRRDRGHTSRHQFAKFLGFGTDAHSSWTRTTSPSAPARPEHEDSSARHHHHSNEVRKLDTGRSGP